MKKIVLFIFLVLGILNSMEAATLDVCSDGTYTTIQSAIDSANNGDTIEICNGTYTENLDIDTNNLTIKSQSGNTSDVTIQNSGNNHTISIDEVNGLNIQNLTVIQSNNNRYGIYITTKYSQNITLDGLHVETQGYDALKIDNSIGMLTVVNTFLKTNGSGDGIDIDNESDNGFTLRNSTIEADSSGIEIEKDINGGITIENSSITASEEAIKFEDSVHNGFSITNSSFDGQSGIDVKDEINGGLSIQDSNITSTGSNNWENGISARGKISGGVTITDSSINSSRYGAYFSTQVNSGVTISNTSITSNSETSLHFQSDLNGGITINNNSQITSTNNRAIFFRQSVWGNSSIDSSAINSSDDAITINSESGSFSFTDLNITSSNGKGIYFNGDMSGCNLSSVTIDSDGRSLDFKNKGIDPTITNSTFTSQSEDAVYMDIANWNDFSATNSCFITYGSNKYALNVKTDQSNNISVSNSCFYATNTAHLASSDKSGFTFTGNYWDGVSGNYNENNVVDNSPLSSCPNSCGISVNVPAPISEFRFDSCKKEDSDFKIDSIRNIEGEPVGNVAATLNAQICNGMQTFDEGDVDAWNAFDTKFNINPYPQGSIVFWFNSFTDWSGSNGLGRVLIDATKGNKYFFLGLTSDGVLKFYFENSSDDDYQSYSTNSYSFSKNTWHQLAISWDETNKRASVFVDGNEIPMTVTQNTLRGRGFGNSFGDTVVGDVRVEYTQNTAVFDGLRNSSYGIFDEVKFYDTPLSEEQVKAIYDNEVQNLDWEGNERSCKDCIAQLPICFEDYFNRNDLKAIYGDKAWRVLQHDNFTPEIHENKLRLTDSQEKISAATNLVPSFNSKNNVFTIEFKHYAYDSSNDCSGDGIAFILSDANTTPESGAFGGSLGYAQKIGSDCNLPGGNCPGFSGGWLGVGIDEYGNFSNPTEGREGGTNRVQNSVAIRGSQGVDRLNGYEFIDGTASLTTNPIAFPDSTTPEPRDTYRVIVDTRNEKTLISIDRDINDGNGYQRLITQTDATQVAQAPDSFIISLSGSTGGCRNIHEIDDLVFRADNCGEFNNLSATAPNSRIWRNCPVNFADGNSSLLTQITNQDFNIYVPILGDDNASYSNDDFNGTLAIDVYTDDQKNNNLSYSLDDIVIPSSDRCHNLGNDTEFANLVNKSIKKVQIEACLSASADSEKTCSGLSDPFSIRPARFNVLQNISLSELRAGDTSPLINKDSIEAVDVNDGRTTDYNTTSADMNISIAVKNASSCDSNTTASLLDFITKKPDDINYSYDDISDINFTDGLLANSFEIAFKDVGELDVNVTVKDSDWTSIDQPNDCIENSHSNTPDASGKVGCDFIGDEKETVRVYPYMLDLELQPPTLTSQGYSSDFIYYGDSGSNFNKSLIFDFTISAVTKDGDKTANYDANCSADFDALNDINISIEGLSDDFILKYKFNNDNKVETGTDSNIFELSGLNTSKDNFSKGSTNNKLSFILDADIKQDDTGAKIPINPIKIDSSDSNMTFDVYSKLDGANVDGNGIDGDLSIGLATSAETTYYFGRLTPIDAQTTEISVPVTFYIDVYCDKSDCGNYALSKKSVKYPANWYINTNENSISIQQSVIKTDNTHITNTPPMINIDNNGTGVANFQKNVNTFYGKAKIDIDLKDSDQTFIYYNPYSDTNITRFYIDFLKKHNESIGVDDVIDNQGKDSDSGRRLRW